MDLVYELIAFIVMVVVAEKLFKAWEIRAKVVQTRINVLKVITKHECFGMFKEEPAKFEDWVGVLLELKGYRKVIVTSRQDDGGKDIVATDRTGKKTFVECKLWDPDNWEINVGRPDAQKLVGAMVVAGINQGLVVTTANLTEKAKQYIKEVNSLGYHVQFIEGDALMRELYDLREIKLKPLLESV